MVLDYSSFLERKRIVAPNVGIDVDPSSLHPAMKGHQRAVCVWAIRKGRAAVWLQTGQGKSLVGLEWARLIGQRTLWLAPLGAAQQLVNSEAPKWCIPCTYARSESEAPAHGITVTNYERLNNFDLSKWGAVVLDEASILAAFTGTVKRSLVARCRVVPYRLTLTATPAPNDTVELCNQADFLSVMPQQEMLSRFFTPKGVEGSATGQYRLKSHARQDFYRWLATWAIACRLPSDLGYSDEGYVLPPLHIVPHFVETDWKPAGQLFVTELKGVTERAQVRRDTIDERVARTVSLVQAEPDERWLLWYGLLDEAALLERSLPGVTVVRGSDDPDTKADALLHFAQGDIQYLVTHPKVAGFGLNFQSCARMAFVGIGDSWQTYYQAIRRCHRFGNPRSVHAHIVLSEPERAVYENVLRKEREADEMTRELVAAMRDFERAELHGKQDVSDPYEPTTQGQWAPWLTSYQMNEVAA